MRPGPLAELIGDTAAICRETDPTGWTDVERDDVLAALGPAAVEIVGLSARIRAARVNGTPVPRPEPKRVEPTTPPSQDPPPEPPAPPAEGTGEGR